MRERISVPPGMKNQDVKVFYEKCYRNDLEDYPQFKNIHKYLYKVVKHYYNKVKNVYYVPHMDYFLPILYEIQDLVNGNFENINENIDFLFLVNMFAVHFDAQLYALMMPNDYYQENKHEYYEIMYEIFWAYENRFRNVIVTKKPCTRIHFILESYMNYVRERKIEFGINEVNAVAGKLGALFYLTDKDINELDEIYDHLFNDYDNIKNAFELNSSEIETNYYDSFAKFIMNYKVCKPKLIIK